jgi:hypothetical protein
MINLSQKFKIKIILTIKKKKIYIIIKIIKIIKINKINKIYKNIINNNLLFQMNSLFKNLNKNLLINSLIQFRKIKPYKLKMNNKIVIRFNKLIATQIIKS